MTRIVPKFRALMVKAALTVPASFRMENAGRFGVSTAAPALTNNERMRFAVAMIPPSGVLRAIQARTGGVA